MCCTSAFMKAFPDTQPKQKRDYYSRFENQNTNQQSTADKGLDALNKILELFGKGGSSSTSGTNYTPPPPPPQKEQSVWPWVIGGLALVTVGGIVIYKIKTSK